MNKAHYTLKNWNINQTIRGAFVSGTVVKTNRPSTIPVGSRVTSAKLVRRMDTVVETDYAVYTLK